MAAMCQRDDGSQAVVVAADRMVTLAGMTEFEHAVPKVTRAARSVVGLVAGDALAGAEIVQGARLPTDRGSTSVEDIVAKLEQDYVGFRRQQVEAKLLLSRGLTFDDFFNRHGSLQPQIVGMLDQQIAGFDLNVNLLIAGVDAGGAHIHTIANPGGTSQNHEVIGYAAIGSGAFHAIHTMIGFQATAASKLEETVFRVFAAKRRAEAAPGVGHELDLLVVDQIGCHRVSDEGLASLEALYVEYGNTLVSFGEKIRGFQTKLETVDGDLA
jgi:hypothetical protein